MNELQVFSELHKFLNGLGVMNYTLAPKSLSVGYTPQRLVEDFLSLPPCMVKNVTTV